MFFVGDVEPSKAFLIVEICSFAGHGNIKFPLESAFSTLFSFSANC